MRIASVLIWMVIVRLQLRIFSYSYQVGGSVPEVSIWISARSDHGMNINIIKPALGR